MHAPPTYRFLFFGLTSYDSLPQREHALASECVRMGHHVDVIEIAPSLAGKTHALYHRVFSPLSRDRGFDREPAPLDLRVHTPPLLPTGFRNSLTPGFDKQQFRRWFSRVFRDDTLDSVIAMIMLPLWWGRFLDREYFNPRLLVYDIPDALEVQSRHRKTYQRLRRCEDALYSDVDLVTFSAREMTTDVEERFPGIASLFLPNAVSQKFIEAVNGIGKKINGHAEIGYIGSTNGKWFDADLALSVIRAFPECRVSVVGPVDKRFAEECFRYPNAFLHGFVHHSRLSAHLQRFDVAIIPFLRNEITRVVNPLKLYEYAAAGLPVVATWTEELQHYEHVVALSHGKDEFMANIRTALMESNTEHHARRRRFAEENTWSDRVRLLIQTLHEHVAVA